MDTFIQKYSRDVFNFQLKAKEDVLPQIRQNILANHLYIILDDDPTGTQTVHNIFVYTNWELETLVELFNGDQAMAFILTNSRAFPEQEAVQLAKEIGRNIKKASQKTGKKYTIVSRGDSTLRGHFPAEVDALLNELGQENAIRMIVPAFFPGGRFTFDDIHYVQEELELIPVANTPFAKDKSFGFTNSDLKDWIIEKYSGQISKDKVKSISLSDIREGSKEALIQKIEAFTNASCCVVNALESTDLQHFVLACQEVNRPVFFRTAASLVPTLIGQTPKDLLRKEDFKSQSKIGNLIVIGSYVPKSSDQLSYFLDNSKIHSLELIVEELFGGGFATYLSNLQITLETLLSNGIDVILFTSRTLKYSSSQVENLAIGRRVSESLVFLLQNLKVKPKNIIAKGGITSSDIATKALNVKKAKVLGQILAGVPVWETESEQKYIVFPGNVGDKKALLEAYNKL